MWFTYASRLDSGHKDEHELVLVNDAANPEDYGCSQDDQWGKRSVDETNGGHEQ